MTSIWEEDPNVYDAHYWRCRKRLDMTTESIKRDVHQLQLWLKNHPYLPRLTGVDEKMWLENYLVLNKNDVERTKKNLDLYFKIRTTLPEGFTNRQAHSADVYQSFKAVCLAIIPRLTKEGNMVVVFNHLNPCVSDFEVVPFAKRMVSMIDIQLRTGIHRSGTILVMDLTNTRIGHLTRYQPLRLVRAFFSVVWAAYPERVAQIHVINSPLILHALMSFFRPFLKEKIRKRIMVHSNLESLYEYVPKSHLPKDYGGECADKLTLNWRWEKIMLEYEEWLQITATEHKIADEKWPPQ